MAKSSSSVTKRVSALIAEIESEAYARGKADARKEILDVLGAAEGRTAPAKARRGKGPAKAAAKRRAGGGRRAPRGSVPRFVQRVLGERPGSTAAEIAGHATDETERSIKQASIGVELRNGRLQGRYVSENGRWALAVAETGTASPAEATAADPSPGSAPGAGEAASGPGEEDGDAGASDPGGEEGKGPLGLNL